MSRSGKECMTVRKRITRLGGYLEAAWMSARFCFMLRKMNRLRAYGTENRQGICWHILCSLMFLHGIFIYTKGNVELMEGNIRGVKMITEGAGAAVMAATLKQDGTFLTGEKPD